MMGGMKHAYRLIVLLVIGKRPAIPPLLGIGVGCR